MDEGFKEYSFPFAVATFCEDIRAEEGGRRSLMGVLGGSVFFPEMPINLPLFCIVTDLHLGLDPQIRNYRIVVDASWLSEPLASHSLTEAQVREALKDKKVVGVVGYKLTADMKFPGFNVPAEGVVRCWIEYGDTKLMAGAVHFVRSDQHKVIDRSS
ncbi:hypothetical protein UF64_10995 [Thalassospira sp. HJ]|uniref:hypothetical protein n=1 Tax=Thalassospira sp. HJ TaxID=1616823 RepID=UPI0005CE2204|nr:hypothetical protein [Thalassospira sp. HJ]KJE35182.1 hypothetical protein UF64_10995 [Thalassospira sp. HJ]